MSIRLAVLLAAIIGLNWTNRAWTDPPDSKAAALAPDIAPLELGPVHEAFASPTIKDALATPIIHKQPPPPIKELPPEQKPLGANVEWIPGYWQWDVGRNDFVWVSGLWRAAPPGRRWVPGYWHQASDGWQWVHGLWAPASQSELPYLPTPPSSLEVGPSAPAPDDNQMYVPGCWLYRDQSYLWRPGFWTSGHAGWVWNASCYEWTPGGDVFVSGYWDYPLEDRGMLFAPVGFGRPLWANPNWAYTPSWVVDPGALLDNLFYQPGWCNYFFGNYYSPYFRSVRGFLPWYAYGRGWFDPLYSYYRWHHRFNHGWAPGLRQTYMARTGGRVPGPRYASGLNRTLTARSLGGSRQSSVRALRRLAHGRSATSPLQRLTVPQQAAYSHMAGQMQALGQTRSSFERGRNFSQGNPRSLSLSPLYRPSVLGGSNAHFSGYAGNVHPDVSGTRLFSAFDKQAHVASFSSSNTSGHFSSGHSSGGRSFSYSGHASGGGHASSSHGGHSSGGHGGGGHH